LKFGSYVCLRSFQRFFNLHLDQLFDDEGMVSHGGQNNVFGLNGSLVSMFILFSVLNYFGHISELFQASLKNNYDQIFNKLKSDKDIFFYFDGNIDSCLAWFL
jgi:hypothetical protein